MFFPKNFLNIYKYSSGSESGLVKSLNITYKKIYYYKVFPRMRSFKYKHLTSKVLVRTLL